MTAGHDGGILYLQCDSGISGDMVVGALLDLGASEEHLRAALATLPLSGYEVRVGRKQAGAVDACDFDVVLDHEHENHDHDMAWLYGDLDGAGKDEGHPGHEGKDSRKRHHKKKHGHHDHEHEHDHEGEAHAHDGEHHHHEHRTLAEVSAIIDGGGLTPAAAETAHRIFSVLAEGEAEAHGTTADQVHFHEVGAVDSIVDIVSVAVCLDDLGIGRVVAGPLAEGRGRVRTQHGVLSVPVPAVAHIVADHALPMRRLEREGEFVTPTGAAIAAALKTEGGLPDAFTVKAVGTGSGKRAYDPPSTVRAFLVEPAEAPASGAPAMLGATEPAGAAVAASGDPSRIWQLTCEVDDCPGEALGYALGHLFEIGVREAHYVPVYMKKNRPAYQIEVICDDGMVEAVERVLFEDTTTIGVRRFPVERSVLARQAYTVQTPLGKARVKMVTLPDGARRAYPEYESVAAIARERGLPYQDVYQAVLAASLK